MEQSLDRTRSIKILLLWAEGTTRSYYRIIDPNPDELEFLKEAHGKDLGIGYLNGTTESAISAIGRRIGKSFALPGMDDQDFVVDPQANAWTKHRISADEVYSHMGWDRICITGISES